MRTIRILSNNWTLDILIGHLIWMMARIFSMKITFVTLCIEYLMFQKGNVVIGFVKFALQMFYIADKEGVPVAKHF